MSEQPTNTQPGGKQEEFRVRGEDLIAKIKEIVKEGNVRRIRILKDDQVVLEFPVTAGAVGALLLPKLAALGALAAFLARCTIEVEKIQQTNTEAPPTDEEVLDEQ